MIQPEPEDLPKDNPKLEIAVLRLYNSSYSLLTLDAQIQASVFMSMMSDHNSSDLAPQCQMASAENNTSGPVPQSVQASVFMSMMSDHNSSDLAPQCHMASAENNTSGPVPQCLVLHQMTSDHNRSELGIQDHSNEQSSSKLVPKVVP
ncbi:hypothetical protein Tco_1359622 [Tanacetum coccineum]